MIRGIITKGIGGFYYVQTDQGLIESRARGIFREDKKVPMIGDIVNIKISEEDNTGYILEMEDRSSQLTRPAVANISKSIIVMSVKDPDINLWLLDKFIVMSEHEGLETLICLNKIDLDREEAERIKNVYEKAGYEVILTSVEENIGIDDLKSHVKSYISALSGPSGVGKSSLLNILHPELDLEVGDVSDKTRRGKHTTRHVELIKIDDDSYVLDTPGFSSLKLDFIEDETEVRYYFKEINDYGSECRFQSCLHDKEPGCMVKHHVELGDISETRYDNYLSILEEVKNIRRY